MLVSADLLAADDVNAREVGELMRAANAGELRMLWIPVRASLHKLSVLAQYQPVHPADQPLSALSEAEQEAALVRIAETVLCAYAGEERTKRVVQDEVGRTKRRRRWPMLAVVLAGLCGLGLYSVRTRPLGPAGSRPAVALMPSAAVAGPEQETMRSSTSHSQRLKKNLTLKGEENAAQDVEARPGDCIELTVDGDVVIDGKHNSAQRVRLQSVGGR